MEDGKINVGNILQHLEKLLPLFLDSKDDGRQDSTFTRSLDLIALKNKCFTFWSPKLLSLNVITLGCLLVSCTDLNEAIIACWLYRQSLEQLSENWIM